LKDSKADVALYVNHRHADVPMASSRAGTLKLSADPNLRAFATLDPLRSDVVIARSAVMRGELPQMSIGFTVNKNRDQWNADYTERVITEVNLMEVSIVRQGANPYTEAAMRSLEEIMESLTDVEMTEDEVRRAIMSLEKRLPAVPVDVINEFAERDRVERERLERKRLLRPAQV
jgi:HK97 family phage prohead protease